MEEYRKILEVVSKHTSCDGINTVMNKVCDTT